MKNEMLERLHRAYAEILAVEMQLNDASHCCPTCSMTVRADFHQFKLRQLLEGARERVKRVVGSIEKW